MPLVFAYASHAESTAHKRGMKELLALVGASAHAELVAQPVASYSALAAAVDRGEVDIAWLPPISYILLEKRKKATPLVSHHRAGRAEFHAVLLVRASSGIATLEDLRGKRAAWVDKHSAAGYVVPRIELANKGIDPRTAFASERFYQSHEAVVRAVVGDKADFGGTYARLDRAGAAVRGAWTELPGAEGVIRVLATFGSIPSDVIAARSDLDPTVRDALRKALIDAAYDVRGAMLVRDLLGVDEFRPWKDEGYAELRASMIRAAAGGLFEAMDGR